jgi:hypothetical protein
MASRSLLQAQTSALLTLLNLNQPPPSHSSSSTAASSAASTRPTSPAEQPQGPLVWKVLVLDDVSKDVLATTLRVQDLREQGVTLHM